MCLKYKKRFVHKNFNYRFINFKSDFFNLRIYHQIFRIQKNLNFKIHYKIDLKFSNFL